MTTVIRAAGAADFLALIPRMTGFVPERSLVLVPFAGNRTAGALRFDLPIAQDLDEIDRIASTLIGLVCKVTATDAVAVIVYTDDTIDDAPDLPHRRVVDAVIARADLCGLRLSDALCVASDGWGSFLEDDLPPGGHPLSEIPHDDPALAGMPMLDGDRAAGPALPRADLLQTERVGRLLAHLDADLEVAPPPAGMASVTSFEAQAYLTARLLEDFPALFEEALTWEPDALHASEATALVWCLARPAVRDIALPQWAGTRADGETAYDAQIAWSEGQPYPEGLAKVMWGDAATPPDPSRLHAALRLCRRIAAVAPRELRPGPLSACAWLAWAVGRSSHAAGYVDAALAIDPEHGMSRIVLTMVSNGHLPEWVFDRPLPPGAPVTALIDSRGVENRADRRRRERAERRR